MEGRVSANRRTVVLLLTSLMLIVLSCSDREMPTQAGASSPAAGKPASTDAAGTNMATSNRGRGTVKVDPREGRDDDKTPRPTVTGTPPTPTATRTPEPEENERTKTPTLTPTVTPTGTRTPLTPSATRTPGPEDDDNENEVEGRVGTVNGTSFVVMTESGPVTVQTNGATQFRGDDVLKTLADVKTGVEVEVQGQLQPDKSILAFRVDIQNED